MKANVIAISREFGSGGRIVGEHLAARLGYEFYDKTLIEKVSERSGFAPEYVRQLEELGETRSLLFQIAVKGYISKAMLGQSTVVDQYRVFGAMGKVIQDLAARGSCVIVGRAASYILREEPNVLRVFLHAPMAARISRVVEDYGVPQQDAEQTIRQRDKARADFHKQFTGQKWDDCRNYHLSIDTGFFGLEQTADLIVSGLGG